MLATTTRSFLRCVAVIAGVVGAMVPGSAVAQVIPLNQSNGLIIHVATTVVVDPTGLSITTTHDYVFTNGAEERDFAGFTETIPGDATVTSAESGRSTLETGVGLRGGEVLQLFVSFAQPLAPGESVEVRLVLEQHGVAGRPEDFGHVSPSLVAVAPFAVGSETGTSTLHVEIPRGFSLDVIEGWDVVPGEETITFVRSEPVAYVPAPLVASNPDALQRQTVPGLDYPVAIATLLGPEGDLAAGVAEVATGLAEWLPTEPSRPVEIRIGWTGDHDVRWVGNDEATVAIVSIDPSEAAIAQVMASVMARELAWADDSLVADVANAVRFAYLETKEFGGGASIDRSSGWAGPLATAFRQAGPEATTRVISMVSDQVNSYPGATPTDVAVAPDWRALLDAIENLTDIDAADRFRAVASPDDILMLAARGTARREYTELEVKGDGWAMPPLLRVPMAAWDFGTFTAEREAVAELIAAHDELVILAADENLVVGPYVRGLFEAAEVSLDDAWSQLRAEEDALEIVGESLHLVTTERGLFARVGMAGIDVDHELDQVIEAWDAGDADEAAHRAEELIETYEGAVGRGTIRLVIPMTFVAGLLGLLQWIRRRLQPSLAE